MEPSSQPEVARIDNLLLLEAQIRELFGRTVYSHKVHEKNADIYLKRLKRIKLGQIILSALTTGSLLVALLGEGKESTVIAAVLSALLLLFNSYTKEYDLGAQAQKHSETASKLWDIRESYFSLLTDIATGQISLTRIREKRDKLQEILKSIYEAAPRTDDKAYAMAQQALKIKEDLTFSDSEIDVFLPKQLQRNPNSNQLSR
jgi:hypothetical protein